MLNKPRSLSYDHLVSSMYFSSHFRKRKSVIVQCDRRSKRIHDEVDEDDGDDVSKIMKLDIDCSIIKSMFSNYFVQAESSFLEKMKDTFEESRSKMSLGQEVVSGYIEFCQFREEFPQEFWKGVSKQFR